MEQENGKGEQKDEDNAEDEEGGEEGLHGEVQGAKTSGRDQ